MQLKESKHLDLSLAVPLVSPYQNNSLLNFESLITNSIQLFIFYFLINLVGVYIYIYTYSYDFK